MDFKNLTKKELIEKCEKLSLKEANSVPTMIKLVISSVSYMNHLLLIYNIPIKIELISLPYEIPEIDLKGE